MMNAPQFPSMGYCYASFSFTIKRGNYFCLPAQRTETLRQWELLDGKRRWNLNSCRRRVSVSDVFGGSFIGCVVIGGVSGGPYLWSLLLSKNDISPWRLMCHLPNVFDHRYLKPKQRENPFLCMIIANPTDARSPNPKTSKRSSQK